MLAYLDTLGIDRHDRQTLKNRYDRPMIRSHSSAKTPQNRAAGKSGTKSGTSQATIPLHPVYNSGMRLFRQPLSLLPSALLALGLLVAESSPTFAQVVLAPGMGGPRGGLTVPPAGVAVALGALGSGDFSAGLGIASQEYRGGLKMGTQRWIDSIATAMAVGECQYELGNFREAVAAYDEALLVSAGHADWLLSVQFPAQGPQPTAAQRVATWGRSARRSQPGATADTMSIRMGGSDPQKVLQQGGVLAAPVNYPVRPQEILLALAISLYRRTEILGPLAGDGTAITEAAQALARRAAPPNHYSQSWLDIALGTALWSQGKLEQAVPLLERGLVMGNQLDHALTSWGLIVLGRIALERDDAKAAAALFEEATYTAADYGDSRALEEAFRLAFIAHRVAGTPGVPASIAGGARWARTNLPVLGAALMAREAEILATSGNPAGATAVLGDIDGRVLRGEASRGTCGAEGAYAAAMSGLAAGDTATGCSELDRALAIARQHSPRLFQTNRLVEMVLAGSNAITDRQADALFQRLLGDPSPGDFVSDPLQTLAVLSTPRSEAFEAWCVAAGRRGNEAALAACEAQTRARWLATQSLGGRAVTLERLLGSDPDALPREMAARRAALLARHPDLARLLNEDARLRTPLTAALLAKAGRRGGDQAGPEASGPTLPGTIEDWQSLQGVSVRRGQAISLLAAGRDPTTLSFPPLTSAADIRRRLAPRQLILSFHWTATGLYGALESTDRAAFWQVAQPQALAREIPLLLRALGLHDPHASVSTDRLLQADWRPAAEAVERVLFGQSKVVLGEGIDELVIVPDGLLWYLPFELLPVGSARAENEEALAGEPRLLHEACRIRYCPTRSLAVMSFVPTGRGGPVGVHTGRQQRGERSEAGHDPIARLTAGLERALVLGSQPAGAGPNAVPPVLPAALCDALIVLDEIGGEGPTGGRILFGRGSDKPGGARGGLTIADWLGSPHKRPQTVVVAGLQSAAAGGLAHLPGRPGEELFVAATDLLAAGAHTALVSRWRTGGTTASALVEEFVRDLLDSPESSASESWRRAVRLICAEEPDLALEPRIKQAPNALLPDARHPFFWAGYMVVDCGPGVPPGPLPPPGKAAAGQGALPAGAEAP